MELGVRVAYPEQGGYDWYEALKPYPAAEIAFRDPVLFLETYLGQIVAPWQYGGLRTKALSIHVPHAKPTNQYLFWESLRRSALIAGQLDLRYMVIHPQNAKLSEVQSFIEYSALWLARKQNRYLCWETFLGKRRFVNTIESIAEAGLYACYDTSHMRRDGEGVLNDLFKYKDIIKVMHLSNWDEHGQHLPLRQGVLDMRTILTYLGKEFDGPVILEYLKKYHHLYLEDLKWAEEQAWG